MKKSQLTKIVTDVVKEMSVAAGAGPTAERVRVKKEAKDVEPKLAAGKIKDNYAVSHFEFTLAPSIPNRKSDAMDYRQLFEGDDLEVIKSNVISWSKSRRNAKQDSLEVNWWKHFDDTIMNAATKDEIKAAILDMYYMGDFDWSKLGLEEAYVPDNIKKFVERKKINNIVNQVADWAEKAGKRIVGGTAIGKNYDTLILDLTHQGSEIYITDGSGIEVNGVPVKDYEDFVKALDSDSINENYAHFRNDTSRRKPAEQLHKAVKEIKKKLQEVDRLVEYTNRLRTEVNEGGIEVQYNTHTTRALEQIQEMIKHTYIKAKKLK